MNALHNPDAIGFMVDIETMGLASNAAIVALGAVVFSQRDGILDAFYENVDLASSAAAGGAVDMETVKWWLSQDFGARRALRESKEHLLVNALSHFSAFLKHWSGHRLGGEQAEFWGNGPQFDYVVLGSAYERLAHPELPVPWKYNEVRDMRTLRALLPPTLDKALMKAATEAYPDEHNALADAKRQAWYVVNALRGLRSIWTTNSWWRVSPFAAMDSVAALGYSEDGGRDA